MRLGCCGNMVARTADGIGAEIIEDLSELGFDYIELPLAQIAALHPDAYLELCRSIDGSEIKCEACNNFFPASIKLTGPEFDIERIMAYAGPAMQRAARLGAKVIVFGSGPAKTVPVGFPRASAWQQLVELLTLASVVARDLGLTVAIEPLRKQECNIINTAAEGLSLAQAVDRSQVGLLVDFFHLAAMDEDCEIIEKAGDRICHIHIAEPQARGFPVQAELAVYQDFFDSLTSIDYRERISIEAYSQDFRNDADASQSLLRSVFPAK